MKTKHPAPLYASGPLFGILCFLTAQRAIITNDQNEALLYTLLATFFGTILVGWAMYLGILIYFRIKDKK